MTDVGRQPPDLGSAIARVLDVAVDAYGDHPERRAALDDIRRRLDEPLRVAVAGRVKSGKSTIVNALVGDTVAATAIGECTRHVVWYRHGHRYRATAEQLDGSNTEVPLSRSGQGVEFDLAGIDPARVRRIVVEWPAPLLESFVLIDTPGLGSLRTDDDQRAREFLGADGGERGADAVVYLARHLHLADVAFLEAFHDTDAGPPSPADTIGVLSRADEIAGGRPDAMEVAERVAARWRVDPQARRLCQTVVTVAGLLATGAAAYTEADHAVVTAMAALTPDDSATLLASADRIVGTSWPGGPTADARAVLVDKLGLFGVRSAHRLACEGADAGTVARALRDLSGIDELRRLLHTRFERQATMLRARSSLRDLEQLIARRPLAHEHEARTVEAALEQLHAGAHELAELRLLVALRNGEAGLTPAETDEVELLLTARSAGVAARLGLAPGDDVRAAVLAAIDRWRRRAEHPATRPDTAEAAAIVTRSVEGMFGELSVVPDA